MLYKEHHLGTMMDQHLYSSKISSFYWKKNFDNVLIWLFLKVALPDTPKNPDNYGSNGYFAAENCIEIYQNGVNDKACGGNSGYACEFDM